MSEHHHEESILSTETEREAGGIPSWRKILFAAALVITLLGGMLYAVAYINAGGESSQKVMQGQQADKQIFRAGEGVMLTNQQLQEWSAVFMKVGISFTVGFILGYIVAGMLKLMLLLLILGLLVGGALFGMDLAKVADIDWGAFKPYVDTVAGWITPQLGGVKELIIKHLLISACTALGFLSGFKK